VGLSLRTKHPTIHFKIIEIKTQIKITSDKSTEHEKRANRKQRTGINGPRLVFKELGQLLRGLRREGVVDEAAPLVQLEEIPGQVFCPDELLESNRGRVQKEGLG